MFAKESLRVVKDMNNSTKLRVQKQQAKHRFLKKG